MKKLKLKKKILWELKINEEEDFFDDGFLILKFKELEEKILQAINGKQYQMNQYKEKINNENPDEMPKLIRPTPIKIDKKDDAQNINKNIYNFKKKKTKKFGLEKRWFKKTTIKSRSKWKK